MRKRWIAVGAIVIAVVVVVWLAFKPLYFIFHTGQPSNSPAQGQIAQGVPTPTAVPATPDWFASVVWLDPVQSAQLRTQTNVVNFAVLQNSGAHYARDFGIPLDSKWQRALNATRFLTENHQGTGIHFTLTNGEEYNLNVLQPFVFQDEMLSGTQPPTLWMFDSQGQLWELNVSQPVSALSPLGQVVAHLPFTVAANPNLTIKPLS